MEGYKFVTGSFCEGYKKDELGIQIWHRIYKRFNPDTTFKFIDQNRHGIDHGIKIKFNYGK